MSRRLDVDAHHSHGAAARANWPIIVGGCPRSGTSLVRRILNAHSRIHCGPEVKFFRDFFGDYFHDPLRHLRFAATARSLLPEPELLDLIGRAFIAMHERAAALAGKPRWADKNPENVLYLNEWSRLLDSRWVMIQVVRNPLDTLASIKERNFPLSIPASLDDRIAFYIKYTQSGIGFGEENPSRYYRVMYERLVASPERVLGGMMEWLDETLEPSQLQFNNSAHQAGLEDPKVALTASVHTHSVGRWRDAFAPDEARRIWSKTRELWNVIDPDAAYLPNSPDDR